MYDIGYGLSKMAEGATAGAAKGSLIKMQQGNVDRSFQAGQDQRQQTNTREQKKLENEEQRLGIQRGATALTTAYNIAKNAPAESRNQLFTSLYGKLDPTGEVPTVTWTDKDVQINYQGWGIAGSKDQIFQGLGVIAKNPDVTPQVLRKLVELGIAKINVTSPRKEKAITVSPGSAIVDPATNKEVYSNPRSAGTAGEYDISKMIDDTRGYYALKMKALMDPDGGGVATQNLPAYNQLLQAMNADLQMINQGQRPGWLTGQEQPAAKTVQRTGMYQGRKVVQYTDGTIDYAD